MNWHVISLTADALNPKARKVGWVGPLGGRYLHPVSRGKLTIAHSCEKLGVELYIPWETKEIIHHRTKKPIIRDFPMIPGYAFVRNISDYGALEQSDGVNCFLAFGEGESPAVIDQQSVHDLMMREFELYSRFEKRMREKDGGSAKRLREAFPKGCMVHVETDRVSGTGEVTGVSRGVVKVDLSIFGKMVKAEFDETDCKRIA